MRLRIHPDAEEEAIAAAHWYEDRREGLGIEFLAAVDATVRRTQHRPDSGSHLETLPDELGVLRLQLKRFPYIVVYESFADEIVILAVAHTKRRPNYWFHRR